MTNKLPSKVRLVKCPRCAKILPEPEQIPLYTCGGCGTILQAKYYRRDNGATGFDSLQQGHVNSNDAGHAPDGGETSSSNQRSSSAGEQSTDQNRLMGQYAVENCSPEQIEAPTSEHHTSTDQRNGVREGTTVSENQDSRQFTAENLVVEDIHRQDEHCDGTTVENHNQKQIGDTSEVHKCQVLESKEQSKLQHPVVNGTLNNEDDQHELSSGIAFDNQKQVREAPVSDESLANGNKEMLQFTSENGTLLDGSDCNTLSETRKELLKGENSHGNILVDENINHDIKRPVAVAMVYENGTSHEDSHEIVLIDEINSGDVKRSLAVATLAEEEGNGKDRNDDVECIGKQLECINLSEIPLSTDITQCVNVDSVTEIESNSRAVRGASASGTSSAIDLITTDEMGSTKISQETRCESNLVDKLTETFGQNIENFDDCTVYGLENVRLANKPERSEPVNKHKEVGSSLKVGPRSLTKGSLAYEGRVSSLDAYDDQVLEQQERFPEETLPGICEESSEWSDMPSSRAYRSSRIRNQPKNSSQVLLDEKLKSSMLEERSLEENVIPRRNRVRPNRERLPPRVPHYWSSEMAYETGSSSSYMLDDLFSHRMHHPPYRYEYSEPWLRKWYSQKGNVDRRKLSEAAWRENEFLPRYPSYETSGEFHHRSGRHSYIDRRRRAESWSQIGNLPPKAYSSELFNGRYQNADPYIHRRPDELRWSAQLPHYMPAACCHQGLCADPSREIRWDPYDLYLTSRQQLEESEFYPQTHDQRHKDQTIRRLHSREKHMAGKRYSRPMAGGAPFVACYFCFKVLQLPEEFIHSRRRKGRTHQLQCGNCSRILDLSLERESCLAPVKPNAGAGGEANSSRNSHSAPSNNTAGSSVQSKQLKVTWQLPARSKSPLHRLMGYSSPRHMINSREIEDLQ